MAEPEISEYASTDDPMFEMPMKQGAYSLTVKRRGDIVLVESLRRDGLGKSQDLTVLANRLLRWQSATGLTLTIVVESSNKKMLRFMDHWKLAKKAAIVYTLGT